MPFIKTVRFIFVLAAGVAAVLIYGKYTANQKSAQEQTEVVYLFIWLLTGMLTAGVVVFAESRMIVTHPKTLFMAMVGLFSGICLAFMLHLMFVPDDIRSSSAGYAARLILFTLFGYLGIVVCLRYVDRIDLTRSRFLSTLGSDFPGGKILDSSVIIDGRFADVIETGFIGGPILIPRFVIQEVQSIADSPNGLKRKRGRRGLDIVRRMQSGGVGVIIVDSDFPDIQAVDSKLVALAKKFAADVITNDYNLNKVAEIQNVRVLNINDLANALRPVVLPDEEIRIHVVKEGKENNQGIGYLEDGTMVVVENGADHINRTVDVTVTRVLQTTAGRMIFTKIADSA